MLNENSLIDAKILFKDLDFDMPVNHLIPRIPQRINYVLWIEDLIKKPENAFGIDIGTY